MMCPLEQMALDHKIDGDIFATFFGRYRCPTPINRSLSKGMRMWYLATAGLGFDDSIEAIGQDWCTYLEQKYP